MIAPAKLLKNSKLKVATIDTRDMTDNGARRRDDPGRCPSAARAPQQQQQQPARSVATAPPHTAIASKKQKRQRYEW